MAEQSRVRAAVNGYGVIGKRVADAIAAQDDMELAGVADITADWRLRMAARKGYPLYAAAEDRAAPMREAGLDLGGTLHELLAAVDVIVDCTPKTVAAKNVETYRQRGTKFILQGGEKHEVTGHSFVAESN